MNRDHENDKPKALGLQQNVPSEDFEFQRGTPKDTIYLRKSSSREPNTFQQSTFGGPNFFEDSISKVQNNFQQYPLWGSTDFRHRSSREPDSSRQREPNNIIPRTPREPDRLIQGSSFRKDDSWPKELKFKNSQWNSFDASISQR